MSQLRNTFDNETLKKIGKGALIAGGAAVLAFLQEAVGGMELGSNGVIITAVLSVLINVVREYIAGK